MSSCAQQNLCNFCTSIGVVGETGSGCDGKWFQKPAEGGNLYVSSSGISGHFSCVASVGAGSGSGNTAFGSSQPSTVSQSGIPNLARAGVGSVNRV
jgi:hypothetical protein